MPNCPVCGKEVQASTTYCPACGANLKHGSAQPTVPSGSYSPSYSYSQQGTGYQAAGQPHSHKKYIIAIIVVGIIGLIAGGLITQAFLIGPDVTDVTGTVTLNNLDTNTYGGTPSQILFGSADTGNLSSTVFQDHSYQTYLPIGETYTVIILWTNVTGSSVGTYSCAAMPGTFSSSNANATQNFAC
jgi:hypothetical protein